MRLQKQKTGELRGKDYYRWRVVIPPDKVKELEWDEGMELDAKIRDRKLVLAKAHNE
jgi:hypothetical protein